MRTVNICETFVSIQGESSYAGCPCLFIRLSGCNLRCTYCDTVKAYAPCNDVPIADLVEQAAGSWTRVVTITGGEPLLQPGSIELCRQILETGRHVLVETNGTQNIARIPEKAVAIMDVKCPASGESASFDVTNIARLRPHDEVKFVLSDRADYEWARRFVIFHTLPAVCNAVLFSPAAGRLDASQLANWMLEDRLAVRLQVQLHKILGVP